VIKNPPVTMRKQEIAHQGAELPAGTVTFLPTDIEGSTRLWEAEPEAMEVALQQHDRLLAEVIESHGGTVVTSRGEGDSFFAVFPSAVSAVEAAGMCQLRLKGEVWPTGSALRVRMGLHTGEVRVRSPSRPPSMSTPTPLHIPTCDIISTAACWASRDSATGFPRIDSSSSTRTPILSSSRPRTCPAGPTTASRSGVRRRRRPRCPPTWRRRSSGTRGSR
jgi:Adenylate and Guanylate cyclase catalytic domain